jgi:predicted nucleic acid-binding protein
VNGYLIDTNVISEFVKPVPNPEVQEWFRNADPNALFVSVITVGEIRLGVENLQPGKRRTELEDWLETGMPGWFAANLLPVTAAIADRWGRLTIEARRAGITLSTADGLIAATTLQHDLTLVTRNARDFAGLRVTVFNPWR